MPDVNLTHTGAQLDTAIANVLAGYADISDATATQGHILTPDTAYISTGKVTGSMPNIGAQNVDISAKATVVTPTAGYHNGSGSVKIATAEQDKIIAGNIKSGVTILGVAGTLTGNWAGTLTFSGGAATAEYYTAAECYLAVNPDTGIALLAIKAANNTEYENIKISLNTAPAGVALAGTSPDAYASHPTLKTFVAVFTGVTGKINVAVLMDSSNSTTDQVMAVVTITAA